MIQLMLRRNTKSTFNPVTVKDISFSVPEWDLEQRLVKGLLQGTVADCSKENND